MTEAELLRKQMERVLAALEYLTEPTVDPYRTIERKRNARREVERLRQLIVQGTDE